MTFTHTLVSFCCAIPLLIASEAASAAVITNSPSLPAPGVYATPAGQADCFPAEDGCLVGLEFIPLPGGPITRTFDAAGDHIAFNAELSGTVTDLMLNPIGPFDFSGSAAEIVSGRASDTATGTFSSQLLSLSVAGVFNEMDLVIQLDPGRASTGQTSITNVGGGNFQISSFFDVFFEVQIDQGPFATSNTAAAFDLVPVPEPPAVFLAGAALMMLAAKSLQKHGC